MGTPDILSLDRLGQVIHEEVNKRFQDRAMPTESVSENFIHQIVRSILKDLEKEGEIPFTPSFKVLNKTSMEERFADNIPDFSKHINLVGLDKERPYDEFGVMNVAFDGDDAERYQDMVEESQATEPAQDTPEESDDTDEQDGEADESEPSSGEPSSESDVEIPDYLTVIEGGKSKS